MARVDQCLLVYRYHEKATTHSVTESVSPAHTHAHILGCSVDPPPFSQLPTGVPDFPTKLHTHTHTDAYFHDLEILRICFCNSRHFPSIRIRNFNLFSSLCGMFSISQTLFGGNRISLRTEVFHMVCVRVCVFVRGELTFLLLPMLLQGYVVSAGV